MTEKIVLSLVSNFDMREFEIEENSLYYLNNVDSESIRKEIKKNIKKGKLHLKKYNNTMEKEIRLKGNEYVSSIQLLKETILSQGKGVISPRFHTYILRICIEVAKRLNIQDMDIINETYLMTIDRYNRFNYDKFENAFAYFTEIIKRGLVNKKRFINSGGVNTYSKTKVIYIEDIL